MSKINEVGNILSALNPLNFLSEMYSSTLNYKKEIRVLDNQMEEMRLHAGAMNTSIQRQHEQKMEELAQRRIFLEGFFCTLQSELKSISYTRDQVLLMAQKAQEKSFESNLQLDERRFYSEQAVSLVGQLPKYNVSGAELLKGVIKALPPVNRSNYLLAEGR